MEKFRINSKVGYNGKSRKLEKVSVIITSIKKTEVTMSKEVICCHQIIH